MTTYEINGAKFRARGSLFGHLESVFCRPGGTSLRENLDVFAEILEGGFDGPAKNERITVRWVNLAKSRERLTEQLYNDLLDVLRTADTVTLETTEFSGE